MSGLDDEQSRALSGMTEAQIDAQIAAELSDAGISHANLWGGGADDPTSAGFIDWDE